MIGEPQIDAVAEKLSNYPPSFKKQFGPKPWLPINPSTAEPSGRNDLMALFFKVIINARSRDKITARMRVPRANGIRPATHRPFSRSSRPAGVLGSITCVGPARISEAAPKATPSIAPWRS